VTLTRKPAVRLSAALLAAAIVVGTPLAAGAAPASDSTTPPDLLPYLAGYSAIWKADAGNTLHGTVVNAKTLEHDDALAVWINQNATKAEQFTALQDSEYNTATNTAYDQSITVSTGLGSKLSAAYVRLTEQAKIPKTIALINSSNGTSGAYVGTSAAKAYFSHPRPFLPSDPTTPAVGGDAAGCAPSIVNASSQQGIRVSRPWADSRGDLKIERVAPVIDTTHRFSPNDVPLDAGYGTVGICTGGSFPSGHTTTAYQAGITLATLLPELAPEILARASEAGNDRIVLGVHYPLDIIGGRIDGEVALAARWSDAKYRNTVLLPARAELVKALEKATGHSLAWDIAHEKAYTSNPYGGKRIPGGTAQIVTNRRTAVSVYSERLTYSFSKIGKQHRAPSVPAGAENLLRTTFPRLSDGQRRSVLAQTEIASGSPLDGTGTPAGAWQRLNLAAATSAIVSVDRHDSVKVLRTGVRAQVITASRHHH
jgi:membrane-associated phospholipid phosphatase